jgi:hypothetical protein
VDDEHSDDGDVSGEREFTFDADSGLYLSTPRRSGWSLVGKIIAWMLILGGLTVVGFLVLVLVALNSWGSNK